MNTAAGRAWVPDGPVQGGRHAVASTAVPPTPVAHNSSDPSRVGFTRTPAPGNEDTQLARGLFFLGIGNVRHIKVPADGLSMPGKEPVGFPAVCREAWSASEDNSLR